MSESDKDSDHPDEGPDQNLDQSPDQRSDHHRDPILDNPYEELDLPSTLPPRQLTALLREQAEMLPQQKRGDVRSGWQALTVNERDRTRFALFARQRLESAPSPDKLKLLARTVREPARSPEPSTATGSDALVASLTRLDLAVPPSASWHPTDVATELDPWPSLKTDPFFDPEPTDDLD